MPRFSVSSLNPMSGSGSPESGTPIDALESGNVTNAADASRMAEILRDMNASGADVAAGGASMPPPQMMPQMQQQQIQQQQMMPQMQQMPMPMNAMAPIGSMNGQMPMMVQQQQQQQPNFVPYDDEPSNATGPKKNIWSNILDRLIDPLIVAVLIFTLSLPVLQTFLSKYATWAFSLGGQLSWLGLIAKSVLGAVLFALYKMVGSALGL
jgi:hypothetical protein